MKILVTGAAGFIGMHVSTLLLARGDTVIGLDNLNDYYDPRLKRDRLARLTPSPQFRFVQMDVADRAGMQALFAQERFDRVVHLAAQAGVRYSLVNPQAYVDSNLVGFTNILEGCRHTQVQHLAYASSSSVYGSNTAMPFSEAHNIGHPVSMYAATKKANELMAHTYSHLFQLPTTGLRFFTVYGPWGRPDMALFRFTQKILAGEPIEVFNHGRHARDFTYIDDIVDGVLKALANAPADDGVPKPGGSRAPHAIYNLGNSQPEPLLKVLGIIEQACGRKAVLDMQPMQKGDVPRTAADISETIRDLGWQPTTGIAEGMPAFVNWFRRYAKL